jgi:hypothetical protein
MLTFSQSHYQGQDQKCKRRHALCEQNIIFSYTFKPLLDEGFLKKLKRVALLVNRDIT